MSAHHDQIASMLDRFAAAWRSNAAAAVAGFFTDDGSLINPFGERADGRAAITAMYARYFQGMLRGTSTAAQIGSVRPIEGQHAFLDADQTVFAPDGSVLLAVHVAALLRREADSWRLVDSRPYTVAAMAG